MSQPFQVQLSRASPSQPWGFRLQGGVDFSTPLSIQSITPGGLADECGLRPGDALLQINNVSSDELMHDDAKQHIINAGNSFTLLVKRGAVNIWQPKVTPLSELRGGQAHPVPEGEEPYVQRTSLAANKQNTGAEINYYNRTARGFGVSSVPKPEGHKVPVVMNAQYNTPMGMYSTTAALEAFDAQSQALVGGMSDYEAAQPQGYAETSQERPSCIRSVRAPTGPSANVQTQQAQHMVCKVCQSLIIGVFVRVKGESMHAECYKCVRCSKSLKNQGFFTIEGQLHCEQCATVVSQPPGSNMVAQAVYR